MIATQVWDMDLLIAVQNTPHPTHPHASQPRFAEALESLVQSSTAKGRLEGSHRGAIHPNPTCGITYDTTSHDKLRVACNGSTYSVMCALSTTSPPGTWQSSS